MKELVRKLDNCSQQSLQVQQSVYLVDDDADIRAYIEVVLSAVGLSTKSFSSVDAFFEAGVARFSGCIVSDLVMPDISGMEFQQLLIDKDIDLPLILMSAHGDIRTAKTAILKGAIDFLEKPIVIAELVDSITTAFRIDNNNRQKNHANELIRVRLDCLTGRERQILDLLMKAYNNNRVAETLNISLRTVETHRNKILKKMHADSFQNLLRTLLLASFYS